MKEIEGKVVTLNLRTILAAISKEKEESPIVEIDGVTYVVEDCHLVKRKPISKTGTGYHSMVPTEFAKISEEVYIIPVDKRIRED